MRDLTDSDEMFNGLGEDEIPVRMTKSDAHTIVRAFAQLNDRMAGDLEKILKSGSPQHLVEAAVAQYNTDVKAMSELSIQVAQLFPGLGR